MNASSFLGKRIRLRSIEPEDAPLLFIWENSAELSESNTLIFPISKSNISELISQVSLPLHDKGTILFVIESLESPSSNSSLGYISLYDYSFYHKRGAIGILIDPMFQKQGYAQEALTLFLKICFEDLLMHQVYAEVLSSNSKASSLFLRVGFSLSATLPQWIRKGKKYYDMAIYTLDENAHISSDEE